MTVNLHDPGKPDTNLPMPLFNLGFRPFFLAAGIFGALSMLLWSLFYAGVLTLKSGALTPFQWHGHEMLLGYGSAVIAGFLLTSVRNWTGQQTPIGNKLLLMVLAWVLARVAFALGGEMILAGVLCNLGFLATFAFSIADKIVKTRQWRQLGIVAVIGALTGAELTVLIGVVQKDQWLISKLIYAVFYLELLLILMMGRRVVPFFIERGVGYQVVLRQSRVLDLAVITGFVGFGVGTIAGVPSSVTGVIAAVLFACQSIRLIFWYTGGIWRKPLLWSLYLAMVAIDLAFLLAAVSVITPVSSYLVLHLFAVGGFGLITLSMMSRVTLGHTGRDVHNPPGIVAFAFGLMILALVFRVGLPLIMPGLYGVWILLAQLCWISAFCIYVAIYLPMLVAPRVDGRPG